MSNEPQVRKKILSSGQRIAILSSYAVPVFLLWILYYPVLGNWWLFDDPCHLFYISQNGIYPAFFEPARGFSPINFTPWEPLSLGIDYLAFGFNPRPFYWHHMLSLSMLFLCANVVLLRFLSPLVTAISLSLFVASVPLCDAANHLMTRHYIEGLLFALVSVYLFLKAEEKDDKNFLYGSAFFYFLACLAKEVYVPLIVIMTVLTQARKKSRLKSLYPFLVVVVGYALWRFYMLNSSGMLSGYPHIPVRGEDILYLPLSIIRVMGWDTIWQWMLSGLLFMAFILRMFRNNWRDNALIIIIAGSVIMPILPVASTLYSRYLFLLSFVFFVGIGFGVQYFCDAPFFRTPKTMMIAGIAVAFVIVSAFHVQKNIRGWQAYGKEISAEGKFLLYNDNPNNLLLTSHGHCYWAFSALRKTVLGLPQGPSFCVRDCTCTYLHPGKKVLINVNGELVTKRGVMEEKSPEACGERRELKIDFYYTNGKLQWRFDPYRKGKYFLFLKGWDSGFIQVKREGDMNLSFDLENDYILAKYESYEGWQTYSPVLKLNRVSSHNGAVSWRR